MNATAEAQPDDDKLHSIQSKDAIKEENPSAEETTETELPQWHRIWNIIWPRLYFGFGIWLICSEYERFWAWRWDWFPTYAWIVQTILLILCFDLFAYLFRRPVVFTWKARLLHLAYGILCLYLVFPLFYYLYDKHDHYLEHVQPYVSYDFSTELYLRSLNHILILLAAFGVYGISRGMRYARRNTLGDWIRKYIYEEEEFWPEESEQDHKKEDTA